MLYKLEQPYVTNWGSFALLQIRGKPWYNFEHPSHCKPGQLLQNGPKFIKNCGRYYKLGQLLQIGV